MPKHALRYVTCLALPFAAAVYAGPVLAQAVEGSGSSKVMMFDRPPSVDELREVVAPEAKVRTRSIEIVGGAASGAAQRPRPTDRVNYGAPPASSAPEASAPAAQAPAPQKAPPRQPPQQAAQPASQQTAAAAPPEPEPAKAQSFGFRINFAFNSAEIPKEFYSYIDSVGSLMTQDSQLSLLVEGHTDAVGSLNYNQALSERRAISVGEYLVRVHHIDPQRIAVAGKGPTDPIASDPYDGRNRRVEFKPAR
ncbi:MAG TPA: OmpA family protein [Azospirillum sp.]|nr:OmpA family protein [Azospirillum sp.]